MANALNEAKTEVADITEFPVWNDPSAPLDEISGKLTMAKTTLNILQMQFKPALDGAALQKGEVCRLLDIAFELVRSAARTTDHMIVLGIPVENEDEAPAADRTVFMR